MEEMIIEKSKVYIKTDDIYITAIDGGYGITNVDINTWILIDEGTGDKYNLCQNNYFDKPIWTDSAPTYAYENGTVRETTPAERQAWIESHQQKETISQLDKIEAQITYTALMTDTLIQEDA